MRHEHEYKDETGTSAVEVKCKHHWIIETPHGPTSRGVCKFCGAENQFENYAAYPSWLDAKIRFREDTEVNEDIEGFSEG